MTVRRLHSRPGRSEAGDTGEREAVLAELRELVERDADDERLGEGRTWLDERAGRLD